MARRTNYGFEKKQRELKKQQKKKEKAERRQLKRPPIRPPRAAKELRLRTTHRPSQNHLITAKLGPDLDPELGARIDALCEEGREFWHRFDLEVRQDDFHPFVAADYDAVLAALMPLRKPGQRFLEWGSAAGIITIMADLLGFDAFGIELDSTLVDVGRELAVRFDSNARFAAGSFIPMGWKWGRSDGDGRHGTIGGGPPATWISGGHWTNSTSYTDFPGWVRSRCCSTS